MMNPIKKRFLNILGLMLVATAFINRFIPGLPTTPLLVLASMIFASVNPKMKDKLLCNKFLGPYLDNYYNKKGMATSYKLRTCTFMLAGMAFSITLINLLWVQILVPIIGIMVTIHIFSARKQKPAEGQYGLSYNLISILLMWIWFGLGLFFSSTSFDYYFLLITGCIFTIIVIVYTIIVKILSSR